MEHELESSSQRMRRDREKLRAVVILDPEPRELRIAMQAARHAIRKSKAEHETTRLELNRALELARKGNWEAAATLRTSTSTTPQFSDLNLESVDLALKERHSKEYRMLTVVLVATALLLVVIAIVELIRRPTNSTP